MFKKILLLASLVGFMSADVDTSAISIKEDVLLKSFGEYRDLAKKLQDLSLLFAKKQREFNDLVKKEGDRLQKLQAAVKASSSKDIAGSAIAMKNFEKTKTEIQLKISAKEKELISIQKQGAESDKAMKQLVDKLGTKIESVLSKVIKDSQGKIKVIYGWPSGRVLYIDPTLDRTNKVLELLSGEQK